jgi:O-antigen/teichoic acid export membrane protein
MFLTMISGPIMSRLVDPITYGIIAPAQSIGSFGKLLAESGFAYHTATAGALEVEEARDLHAQSVRLSLTIAVIATFASQCYSGNDRERLARGVLAFLLVALAGFSAVPIAWAQRTGHFAKLEWWGVAGQAAVTFLVAIPTAYFGGRLLAVNANLVLPTLLALIVAWKFAGMAKRAKTPLKLPASYRLGNLSSNVGSFLAGNVDILLLSTYVTPTALGVYSRANLLASLPGTVVSAAIARVGLISLSKSRDWTDHRRFLWKSTVVTLLAFGGLALLAGFGFDVTGFAFGSKFSTLPLGFALLTVSQVFFYGGSLLDTYLTVRRRLGHVGISHIVQAIFSGIGFLVLRPTTLLSIAWVLLIPAALRYLFLIATVLRQRHEAVGELTGGNL